jgi:hypothetical protein
MELVLLNLWSLPFTALVAGPVVIHLLARRRPKVFLFPSLRFLLPLQAEARRVSRPRDWLLLLARTLFMLFLVAAFCRPVIHLPGMAERNKLRRDVVVLVDASLSMRAGRGGVTRFSQACAKAAELMRGLRPGDRANLIMVGARPRASYADLSPNYEALAQELASATATMEHDDLSAALNLAAANLAAGDSADNNVSRELYLFSDFQAVRSQGRVMPPLPAGTLTYLVPCDLLGDDGKVLPNVGIGELSLQPVNPVVGEMVTVSATVWNYSDKPLSTKGIALAVGEDEYTASLMLQPWSRSVVHWTVNFAKAQDYALHASLSAPENDSLLEDNGSSVVVPVREKMQVMLHVGNADVASLIQRALRPFGTKRDPINTVPYLAADLNKSVATDMLVWAGGKAKPTKRVMDWVKAGGGLVWLLPMNGGDLEGLPGGWLCGKKLSGAEYQLEIARRDDPLLAVFEGGACGDLAEAVFTAARPLSGGKGDVVLALAGKPALVRVGYGQGQVYLWSVPLLESNWPKRATFLPLVRELAKECRCAEALPECRVGMNFEIPFAAAFDATDVRLVGPDRQDVRFLLEPIDGGTLITSPEVNMAGVYVLQRQGKRLACRAVVLDPGESDLRTQPAMEVSGDGQKAIAITDTESLARIGKGREIWPELLLIAAIALIFELGVLLFWAVPGLDEGVQDKDEQA